ncbi:lysozyme inhibitor LprI family protein [Paracoccus sp. (in: a-proteobacteria)]|uniref:lysozyme inhibitor LprI family protein n=1 Tax=Paracoccus sp. TaxID=267 RepID=UPI0035B169ED
MNKGLALVMCLAGATSMMAPPAVAGDSSGLDPAVVDQCLADAATDGARLDCAGAGQESCLAYAEAEHGEVAPVDRQLNCLDAEWQAWEAKLNEVYDDLKAVEEQRGPDRAEALVAMERSWIAFRDARCAYDRLTNGGGTGGATAEPLCKLNETARQVILLMAYRRDRT